MPNKSAIEWTDRTWNPVTGCTKISPGCAHCYAEAVTLRFKRGPEFLPGITDVQLHRDRLTGSKSPLSIQKPQKIFVCSMSDLFHEDVSDAFIGQVFAIMWLAKQHTFQILTKRPDRMRVWMNYVGWMATNGALWGRGIEVIPGGTDGPNWPLSNVWIGTSVENQHWADIRIPLLLQVPAAVRFISAEPLLKRLDLRRYYWQTDSPQVHWVIAGGESGPGRREMDVDWVQDLADQCAARDVAFFVKQDGGSRPGKQGRIPDDLWNRKEFPNVHH